MFSLFLQMMFGLSEFSDQVHTPKEQTVLFSQVLSLAREFYKCAKVSALTTSTQIFKHIIWCLFLRWEFHSRGSVDQRSVNDITGHKCLYDLSWNLLRPSIRKTKQIKWALLPALPLRPWQTATSRHFAASAIVTTSVSIGGVITLAPVRREPKIPWPTMLNLEIHTFGVPWCGDSGLFEKKTRVT